MILIGIDPGSNGGIAVRFPDGNFTAVKMPDTDTDTYDYLKQLVVSENQTFVLCEKVGGFIGTRKRYIQIMCPHCRGMVPYTKEESDPSSRMFQFGDGNGFIRGVCVTLGYGYDTIAPKSWQKIFNLFKTFGMSKTQWKNILKDRAQKLFPELKVTLNTADALLILDVLMRMKLDKY